MKRLVAMVVMVVLMSVWSSTALAGPWNGVLGNYSSYDDGIYDGGIYGGALSGVNGTIKILTDHSEKKEALEIEREKLELAKNEQRYQHQQPQKNQADLYKWAEKEGQIQHLKGENERLQKENAELKKQLEEMHKQLAEIRQILQELTKKQTQNQPKK